MEDLTNINKCVSITELIDRPADNKEVEEKFDILFEKIGNNNEGDNFEAIVSVNKNSKTAVITPVVRKKHLVDYESSESEDEKADTMKTPHVKFAPKTPRLKRQRAATPHVKKFLNLMRQKVVEEYEETVDDDNYDGSPVNNKTTPSRSDEASKCLHYFNLRRLRPWAIN